MNSDHIESFDRSKISGRVSSSANSTRPSSSASFSSSSPSSDSGVILGGEKVKDYSNLLNLSTEGGNGGSTSGNLISLGSHSSIEEEVEMKDFFIKP